MSNPQEIIEKARKLSPQIIELRRQLHAAPELSFQEINTARIAHEHLEKLGFTIQSGIAKTGLIADLSFSKSSKNESSTSPENIEKIVAIRSDMDALPGFETNRTSYSSQSPGVMHACGHDAHVAIVLAAAQLISEEKPHGQLRIIMQPGTEEAERDGNSSAKTLMEAGALSGVSALLGLHVDATIETGRAAVITSQLNSQVSTFAIDVSAEESQGKSMDALPKANALMTGIYKLAAEQANRGLVSIALGSCISSSHRGSILSPNVTLAGTISSTTPENLNIAIQEIEKLIARENTEGFSISLALSESDSTAQQSTHIMDTLRTATQDLLGESHVASITRKTWAADFALLASAAPAAFVYLGAQIAGARRIHHQPTFDLDESGLHLGAAILALTALRLME